MLRSYAGGVREVTLTGPVSEIALSASVSSTAAFPDGSNGPMAVVIGKGTANEEKILVGTATGGTLTFVQRGYDGTNPLPHSAGEEVRLIITAIDAQEANAHVNSSQGVHGLDITDSVAGINAVQAFSNKTIDGNDNTVVNIDPAGSPAITGLVSTEAAARLAGDSNRYSKAEADALFQTLAGSAAADAALILAHTTALDPHIQYLQKAPTIGGLNPVDLPKAYSGGRVWHAALNSVTVSDGSPDQNIVVLPTINPGATMDRLFRVTFQCRGFTTGGVDGDTARSNVQLECTVGGGMSKDWLGWTGDPVCNRRLPGNVSVPADGMTLSGLLLTNASGNNLDFKVTLHKISGVNTTNSVDGALTVEQVVI